MKRIWISFFLVMVTIAMSQDIYSKEKEEIERVHESQKTYQRKSITFFGTRSFASNIEPGLVDYLQQKVRNAVEMKRFDYNYIPSGNYTMEEFAKAVRAYVDRIKFDRARAEAEFSERFKEINITADDIDRIVNSAYFYKIYLYSAHAVRRKKKKAVIINGQKRIKKRIYWDATVVAGVKFYKVLFKKSNKPYRIVADIKRTATAQAKTRYQALKDAIDVLALMLNKAVRNVEDFKLSAPITRSTFNSTEFMLGKKEGLKLDWGFKVYEFTESGERRYLGYVKVRDVADNTKIQQPSRAQNLIVKRGWHFDGGQLLVEYPKMGLNVGIGGGTLTDGSYFQEKDGILMTPGLFISLEYDTAATSGISESYVFFDTDISFPTAGLTNIQALLGIRKKMYLHRVCFVLGAGIGGGYMREWFSNEQDPDVGTSFGAAVEAGFEFLFSPDLSLFINGEFRAFLGEYKGISNEAIGPVLSAGIKLHL